MKDMTNKPFWEESFSKLEAVDTFGEPAEELVSLVNSLPSGASVLDIIRLPYLRPFVPNINMP